VDSYGRDAPRGVSRRACGDDCGRARRCSQAGRQKCERRRRGRARLAMTLTRVGQLETVIRVSDAASSLPGRIDDLARERLPAALALAVERALPESHEV